MREIRIDKLDLTTYYVVGEGAVMEESKEHLIELPAGIDKMTDEELDALAERIYNGIMGAETM